MIVYFDCPTGISGDMTLGALVDLGVDVDALRAGLAALQLEGWSLAAERVTSHGISGTRLRIEAAEQEHGRHLADIRAIIEAAALPEQVKQRSLRVFELLAEAEARVHGVGIDEIHFHEVGAVDAIVDIVGCALALHQLGVGEIWASPLPLGQGWVNSAHGRLPIPAPATLELLAAAGAPTRPDDDLRGELVTPTGAALLAALATFGRPAMTLRRIGYGFGQRDIGRANAVRAWLAEKPGATPQMAVLLETNIDDQPGEQLAYVIEALLELGALDAWLVPIVMKKGRPAAVLSALVPDELEDRAAGLIFRETTTLGLRRRPVERHVCDREIVTVDTSLGPVRVKRKRRLGEELGAAPEYEDCARLARANNVPLREIYAMALQALAARDAADDAAAGGSAAALDAR